MHAMRQASRYVQLNLNERICAGLARVQGLLDEIPQGGEPAPLVSAEPENPPV
jgi:hypothetical protein